MLSSIIIYLLIGVLGGSLAGFFGIGGGIILVPALLASFKYLKFSPDIRMHLVLGTSLACIFITALNSVWAHQKNKNIKWSIFNKLFMGIFGGTLLGAQVADKLSSSMLEVFFAIFLTFVFFKMCLKEKPKKGTQQVHNFLYWLMGILIGFKSAILGVGGGTLSIPFLIWSGENIKKAVGISASIGLPIAFFGCLSYAYNGYGKEGLPNHSFGYIYLPAFFSIISTSAIFAQIGAKLSHRISHEKLRYLFLTFLFIVLVKTYYGVFT